MIEVLFGESEAGAMKAAKNKVVIGTINGPVSVWMAGKKTPPKKPFAGWIEGTAKAVVCLNFMMDIGDIAEPVESPYRRELIYSMYAQDQWAQEEEAERELRDVCDQYAKELQRLKHFLEDRESVRIWYSDAPYSRCGFYSLCRMLEGYENEISAVKLPEYVVRDKAIVSYHSWNDIPAEEFAAFLPCEKPLSREEIRMYAMLWDGLVEENSPLRAVVNGKVVSVSEEFYDFLIWRWLGDAPTTEGRVIGNILGHTQIGVGDWWYARRIEHYIGQGKIEIVEDSENKYARVICAVG
ncbi:DUF1835 domain-containing protein [bacterium 1XD8-76]|nr:DUF1835 domain-containing protein [bacterium 1XD8-76]